MGAGLDPYMQMIEIRIYIYIYIHIVFRLHNKTGGHNGDDEV